MAGMQKIIMILQFTNVKLTNMKKYEVTLFILGLPLALQNFRYEEVEANSQEEAEQMAHDMYYTNGWGVYDSKEI